MSGRIRTVKPELLEDAITAGLSDRAFRLFVSAILLADDYGNLRDDSRALRGAVYWMHDDVTTDDVAAAWAELARKSLVRRYEVRGQTYAHIVGWSKHQKVAHPGKPRVPAESDPEVHPIRCASTHDSQPIGQSSGGIPRIQPTGQQAATATEKPNDISTVQNPHEDLGGSHETLMPDLRPRPRPTTSLSSTADAVGPGPPAKPGGADAESVRQVLEHWVKVLYPTASPPPKLTEARKRRVKARMAEGFTPEQLVAAITGASHDDWLMGRDPKARRGGWRDVETVLRDAPQVERLIGLVPVANPEGDPWGITPTPAASGSPRLEAFRAKGKPSAPAGNFPMPGVET